MAAKQMKTMSPHRILWNKDHLDSGTVSTWVVPSAAQVDKIPNLPEPPERGWVTGSAEGQQPQQKLPWGINEGTPQEFIHHHRDQTIAVLRTILRSGETGAADGPLAGLTSRQLVAAFLAALGDSHLRNDLTRNLTRDELLAVVEGIALDGDVTRQTGMHVFEHVQQRILSGDYVEESGRRFASQVLRHGLSKGSARAVIDRTFGPFEPPPETLDGYSPEALAPFVSQEHPQTIALILRMMNPELAAGVISRLPEGTQGDVAHRMATSEQASPERMQHVWEGFMATLRSVEGGGLSSQQDLETAHARCVKAVADMLNFAPAASERAVLNHLDATDHLGDAVRNAMFSFADIAKMSNHDIQVLLRQTSKEDLVVAFKSAEVDLVDKFLKNMSERVRDEVREEVKITGPMRLSEIEAVQLRIVQQVRNLEEQGEVVIVRGHPGDPFVGG
jgi:flagellar motor switch protein FliG